MSKSPLPDFGKVSKESLPFGDRLSGLCAIELAATKGNPELAGEMIERLANSLAFTIAIACKGDPTAMDEMIEGATSYLYEAATSHQKIGRFMAPNR